MKVITSYMNTGNTQNTAVMNYVQSAHNGLRFHINENLQIWVSFAEKAIYTQLKIAVDPWLKQQEWIYC